MNTVASQSEDLRYAEYVLGVLDADARAGVEREIAESAQAQAAVALWQRHLLPLSEDIAPITPAVYVWARISAELGFGASVMSSQRPAPAAATPEQRASWWDNLRLWRWVGVGASAVAVASLVTMLVMQPHVVAPPTVAAGYMVSSIQQDNGVAGWTATMDLQHAQMVVVPANPAALANGKAPELWLIPPGGKPIALGVIHREQPTTVSLSPDLLAKLGAQALLAVSVEPPGGSPTGQPTGPVIAKGAIRAA
jgi:anti-sigma-K factor RskA